MTQAVPPTPASTATSIPILYPTTPILSHTTSSRYTSREPHYLEQRWWINFGHTPATGRSFPSRVPCRSLPCDSADQDDMQCRAASLPALVLPSSGGPELQWSGGPERGGRNHRQGHSSTCEADAGLVPSGRWVDARKCAASFGRHHDPQHGRCTGAKSFRDARVWVPFGCGGQRARCAPDIRRCLAGRRLVVVGDSIANGFALDVCERLRGNCTRWPSTNGEVVLSAAFGTPPRVGLRNVVEGRAAALWTAALAAANNTIVVLQSGAHDIALPPPGMPIKVAPLAAYRHHLREVHTPEPTQRVRRTSGIPPPACHLPSCTALNGARADPAGRPVRSRAQLAHIVARAQAANPTLLVVWRQVVKWSVKQPRAIDFCFTTD